MLKWNNVVDNAIEAFRSGKYVYFYGAKNIVLTNDVMNYLVSVNPTYFSRYSASEMVQIRRNSLGKVGIDCSGFTGWICTGDKQYSIGQINNCSRYSSLANGKTGSIIFTTWGGHGRHIGLDVGCGLAMHIGWESTDRAIAEGRAGILFEPITARAWEKSGESKLVDYTGAYSPYAPTLDLWNEIHGEPSPSPAFDGYVGETYRNALVSVYSEPSVNSKLLADWPHLALGNLFEVVDEKADMLKIKIANKYIGWIEKKYCLRKTPYKTGKVGTDLHLRANAGTNFKSLTVMPKGATVQICDVKPSTLGVDWYYVFYKGMYGFASARYIK